MRNVIRILQFALLTEAKSIPCTERTLKNEQRKKHNLNISLKRKKKYYEKQKYSKSDTASGIESIIYLEERADVKQRQRHRRADDDVIQVKPAALFRRF